MVVDEVFGPLTGAQGDGERHRQRQEGDEGRRARQAPGAESRARQ